MSYEIGESPDDYVTWPADSYYFGADAGAQVADLGESPQERFDTEQVIIADLDNQPSNEADSSVVVLSSEDRLLTEYSITSAAREVTVSLDAPQPGERAFSWLGKPEETEEAPRRESGGGTPPVPPEDNHPGSASGEEPSDGPEKHDNSQPVEPTDKDAEQRALVADQTLYGPVQIRGTVFGRELGIRQVEGGRYAAPPDYHSPVTPEGEVGPLIYEELTDTAQTKQSPPEVPEPADHVPAIDPAEAAARETAERVSQFFRATQASRESGLAAEQEETAAVVELVLNQPSDFVSEAIDFWSERRTFYQDLFDQLSHNPSTKPETLEGIGYALEMADAQLQLAQEGRIEEHKAPMFKPGELERLAARTLDWLDAQEAAPPESDEDDDHNGAR